jgi:hypothetical protein
MPSPTFCVSFSAETRLREYIAFRTTSLFFENGGEMFWRHLLPGGRTRVGRIGLTISCPDSSADEGDEDFGHGGVV